MFFQFAGKICTHILAWIVSTHRTNTNHKSLSTKSPNVSSKFPLAKASHHSFILFRLLSVANFPILRMHRSALSPPFPAPHTPTILCHRSDRAGKEAKYLRVFFYFWKERKRDCSDHSRRQRDGFVWAIVRSMSWWIIWESQLKSGSNEWRVIVTDNGDGWRGREMVTDGEWWWRAMVVSDGDGWWWR